MLNTDLQPTAMSVPAPAAAERTAFDAQPCTESKIEDLALGQFDAYRREAVDADTIRELLMNAVMHRNYNSNSPIRFYAFADHIEIQSPGGLYGEATAQNFPTRNSYRNPVIAEALKSLGFVNRFGYGVQRAQALLADNGNPPAVFEFDAHSVLVKIYKRAV
jgi:predicted HTH transcriptional regulator